MATSSVANRFANIYIEDEKYVKLKKVPVIKVERRRLARLSNSNYLTSVVQALIHINCLSEYMLYGGWKEKLRVGTD